MHSASCERAAISRAEQAGAEAQAIADSWRPVSVMVRVLPDGSVAALCDLLFTRAICLGVTREKWSMRFCFEDRTLADKRFAELQSEDDEPAGYVARRWG